MGRAREEKVVIFIFVGITANTVFFRKQPEINQKLKIKHCHATLKVIQHGMMIVKLRYLRANCRHSAWKFDGIGNHVNRYVEKLAPLCCLSVQFFAKFRALKKGIPTRIKNNWLEQMGRTPTKNMSQLTLLGQCGNAFTCL